MGNNTQANVASEGSKGVSRRAFLQGAGAAAAVGAVAAMPALADEAEIEKAESGDRLTTELDIPEEVDAPEVTDYEADVLVIGGGFAGITAAAIAAENGASVVLVDKGHPGYSGLTPYPQCFCFFDEEYGDDRQANIDVIQQTGEYISNLDWYNVWLEDSKPCWDLMAEWGIVNVDCPRAVDGDWFDNADYRGYHETFIEYDRRARFNQILVNHNVTQVDHVMITDVLTDGDQVIGALGFDVPSATIMTFRAKAVVMAMGQGAIQSNGYPQGPNSFDGEWIGYNLGLPIGGKEFSQIHNTSSLAPGNAWYSYNWGYLEPMSSTGNCVTSDPESIQARVESKSTRQLTRFTRIQQGVARPSGNPLKMGTYGMDSSISDDPDDPRLGGNMTSALPSLDIDGGALCGGIHQGDGIYCSEEVDPDFVGATAIKGLYAAGACHASMTYGALYGPGEGGSTSMSTIQGRRAGKAAAEYAAGIADIPTLDQSVIEEKTAEIMAPMELESGFDPNWAESELQAIMSPYWVEVMKDEESLTSTLESIIRVRDNIVPLLIAESNHDLRLCHEIKHKVLTAEMRLRASLERKESRGMHYRVDYPYRNDEIGLCYTLCSRGDDGEMVVTQVPVKDEWKGDLSQPYEERYIWQFPGEKEALDLEGEYVEVSGWNAYGA